MEIRNCYGLTDGRRRDGKTAFLKTTGGGGGSTQFDKNPLKMLNTLVPNKNFKSINVGPTTTKKYF